MEQFLETLKTHASVGLVGGSDLVKIAEQMKGKNKIFINFKGRATNVDKKELYLGNDQADIA